MPHIHRTKNGATLLLIAASIIVVVIIGIACALLMLVLGGSRELQNANDAGSLGVASKAIKVPGVKLDPGIEQNNFAAHEDEKDGVNLESYNKVAGQVLLVSLNAKAQGTEQAFEHARTLIDQTQQKSGGLGQRLLEAMKSQNADSNPLLEQFSQVSQSNSLRMLGPNGKSSIADYQTSFIERGTASNMYIADGVLPTQKNGVPNGIDFSQDNIHTDLITQKKYVVGYKPIDVDSSVSASFLVPIPHDQPHLVSQHEFEPNRQSPLEGGFIPPNGFKTSVKAQETTSSKFVVTQACSVVGSLNRDFPVSIPRGYIIVSNPAGLPDPGRVPSPNSIFNNELFTGIAMANNGAFSTDSSKIIAWAEFNKRRLAAKAVADQTAAASAAASAAAAPYNNAANNAYRARDNFYPAYASAQNYANQNPGNAAAQDAAARARATYDALNSAAGQAANTARPFNDAASKAAQDANAAAKAYNDILAQQPSANGVFGDRFGILALGGGGYPSECNYLNTSGPGLCVPCAAKVPEFSGAYGRTNSVQVAAASQLTAVEKLKADVMASFPSFPGGRTIASAAEPTGLRLFDHSKAYPVASGHNASFTKPGTASQLLKQVGNGADEQILPQISQRIREIKPDASEKEIMTMLESATIDVGESAYVFLRNNQLVLSKAPPEWIVPDTEPDGKLQVFRTAYDTLGLTVNPPGESGFRNVIFEIAPPPSSAYQGVDEAGWTPSSGFNNLLGKLEFRNLVNGKPVPGIEPGPSTGPGPAPETEFSVPVHADGVTPITGDN